jgi:hypothetical protein
MAPLTPTQAAVDEAIDNAYMLGQIDVLRTVFGLGTLDQVTTMRAIMSLDGVREMRDELSWRYICWCFAQNCVIGALGTEANANAGLE